MRSLTCTIGTGTCNFIVTANTDSDVVENMMEHARFEHSEELVYGSEDDFRDKFYGETIEVGPY